MKNLMLYFCDHIMQYYDLIFEKLFYDGRDTIYDMLSQRIQTDYNTEHIVSKRCFNNEAFWNGRHTLISKLNVNIVDPIITFPIHTQLNLLRGSFEIRNTNQLNDELQMTVHFRDVEKKAITVVNNDRKSRRDYYSPIEYNDIIRSRIDNQTVSSQPIIFRLYQDEHTRRFYITFDNSNINFKLAYAKSMYITNTITRTFYDPHNITISAVNLQNQNYNNAIAYCNLNNFTFDTPQPRAINDEDKLNYKLFLSGIPICNLYAGHFTYTVNPTGQYTVNYVKNTESNDPRTITYYGNINNFVIGCRNFPNPHSLSSLLIGVLPINPTNSQLEINIAINNANPIDLPRFNTITITPVTYAYRYPLGQCQLPDENCNITFYCLSNSQPAVHPGGSAKTTNDDPYYHKYIKYKMKYLNLKNSLN
jgi:hypothetical protein